MCFGECSWEIGVPLSFQMVLLMGECRGMRFAEPSFKTLPESMHHSVLPSSHRMTDRHSPAGTALLAQRCRGQLFFLRVPHR